MTASQHPCCTGGRGFRHRISSMPLRSRWVLGSFLDIKSDACPYMLRGYHWFYYCICKLSLGNVNFCRRLMCCHIVVTWKVKRGKSMELFCGTWYCPVGIDLNFYQATDYTCFRLCLGGGSSSFCFSIKLKKSKAPLRPPTTRAYRAVFRSMIRVAESNTVAAFVF
jgi:hypothetical protein